MSLRRKDHAAWDRVRELLTGAQGEWWRSLTHAEVAAGAMTTYEVVRAVRRELGQVGTTPRKPEVVAIGSRLLRGMQPRHVEALRRLAAAHARGGDMAVRAILGGADMQQILDAARRAS